MSLEIVKSKTVFRLILNRPNQANAMSADLISALDNALKQIVREKPLFVFLEARYLNEERRVFCSGGDLKGYAALKSKTQGVTVNRKMTKVLSEIQKLPSVFIALVDGLCVGGGCETVLACDRVIATSRARFQFGQIHVGLTPGWGGAQRLKYKVGYSHALEWLGTGRLILPEEALQKGLVHELVSTDQLSDPVRLLQNWKLEPEVLLSLKAALNGSEKQEQKTFEKLWWSKSHLAKLAKFRKK